MTAKELQKALTAARGQYTPGFPMDARIDQDVLCGFIDGLGGEKPLPTDKSNWGKGIAIGYELMKAMR
jgi:hypothetical protein